MAYGVSRDGPHRIDLKAFDGSDNYVLIRAGRSSGAATRVASAAMRLSGVLSDGTPQLSTQIDMTNMRTVLFQESITEWSLKASDDDTSPMPLNINTFENVLDSQVASWLDGEITRYYATRVATGGVTGERNGTSSAPSKAERESQK